MISLLGVTAVQAQSYPAKSVRIIVPFAAGGNTDFTARTIAAKLTEALGQQFLVDNRPGASTNIGSDMIVKAAPDGYNILLGGAANAINVAALAKVPFDLQRELAPIILCVKGANVLSIHPSLPAKNLQELIALAKTKPGQLNYGTSGVASSNHMAGELFQLATATRMTHIPFKGMAPAIADLVGGSVEASWLTTITSVPLVEAGRLRMLAVTTAKRVIALPDIPTFAEAGVPGVVVVNWYGLAAPLHTPKAAVDRIANESARIMKSPALASRLAADGSEAMGSTPAEFAALIRAEQNQWAKVIKQAGIVGR